MKGILFLLLIAGLALANSSIVENGSNSNMSASYDSNLSAVMVKIQARIETNATTTAEYDAFLQNHTLLVIGNNIDLSERLLLESVKASNSWLAKSREVNESAETAQMIDSGQYKLVILVGGPVQDNITAIAKERGWLNESNNIEAGFTVEDGKHENGAVVISISDKKGYDTNDLQRQSVNYSPLGGLVPKEYIPLTATAISMLLIVLVNIAWNVFAFKAVEIGRKGKKVGEGAMFYRGINITEFIALVAASVILGISISWQYFGPSADLVKWLAINSLICLFAAITHEIAHMVFARAFKIKLEYRLWPAGAVLTLISSYLGNAFAVQGFILEEIPAEIPKWKVGLMKLAAPALSASIMIFFAILNFYHSDPLYKLIYSTSGVWAMVEILPFGSLDGKDIKDWNRDVWYLTFFVIGASYFIVTFLL